ncbi:ANTAR domain-containing protein [Amycolatopsis sp. A133]|uniref:ANTAR domain-containing protein n=1 Tax=Amycolatopsis sp. A133 TaxID=3064472 RepID=UPI0027F4E9BE|nr:ANTAR domain-containing protein [Amycolatopsis sp. A133]MDQ7807313.1 ANTAR domain-containing protein [Amycolatopsis sp. A133]
MEHDRGRCAAGEADPAAENAQLREALSSRPVIDQAKGMVMLLRGCTAAEAFGVLVAVSQQSNVKLRDVATVVVAAGSEAEPGLSDEDAERAVRAVLCGLVGEWRRVEE